MFKTIIILIFLIVGNKGFSRIEREPDDGAGNSLKNNAAVSVGDSLRTLWVPSVNANSVAKRIQSELKQSIYIETNPNRGAFYTQIPIELPNNLTGFGSLILKYNSQNYVNVGMGIGWDFELPKIANNNTFENNVLYTYSGMWGSFELIEVKESISTLGPLIKILSGLKDYTTQYFRPSLDEGGYLFVKVSNNDDQLWVALSPSGERWLFNRDGRPIRLYNKNKIYIDFKWQDGVLVSIIDPYAGFTVTLTYSSEKQLLPNFVNRQWFYLPKGLNNVTVASKQDNSKKIIRFTYDNEYLIQAKIEGALKYLLIAKYQNITPQFLQKTANTLVKNDKKTFIDKNNSNFDIIDNEDNMIYVDINGDQKTDRIVINSENLQKKIKDRTRYWVNDEDFTRDFNNDIITKEKFGSKLRKQVIADLNAEDVEVNVELAWAANPSDTTNWKRDNSIDILGALHRKNLKLAGVTECGDNLCITNKGTIQFINLKSNALKDLIYIPVLPELENQKMAFSKWLYAKYNNLKPEIDYPNLQTATPYVWILDRDFSKTQQMWDSLKQTSTPIYNENLLIGHFKLTAIDDVGCLSLNQQSPVLDVGGGIVGWYAGAKLNLVSGFDREQKKLNTTCEHFDITHLLSGPEFIKQNNLLEDVELSHLIKLYGYQKWQVASFREILSRYNADKTQIIQNGSQAEIKPGTPVALMSEVETSFGGKYLLKYKYFSSLWVIDSIKKQNLNDPESSSVFSYNSVSFDPFRGTWLGFNKVNIEKNFGTELLTKQIHENTYYKDDRPETILYAARARLNGRMLSEKVSDLNKVAREIRIFSPPEAFLMSENRLFLMPFAYEWRKYKKNGTDFFAREKKSYKVLSWASSSENQNILPLNDEIDRLGIGYWSEMSDSLMDAHEISRNQRQFYPAEYIVNTVHTEIIDKNKLKSEADRNYKFDDSGTLLISSCIEKRCLDFKYDEYGRQIEAVASSELWSKMTYAGATPQVINYATPDQNLILKWNYILNKPTAIIDSRGGQINYQYTMDGLTQQLSRKQKNDSAILFQFNNLTLDQVNKREFEVQIADKHELWRVDGFGEIKEKFVLKDGKWFAIEKIERVDDIITRKWKPLDWKGNSELVFKHQFDELGQLSQQWTRDTGTMVFIDDDNCRLSILNGAKTTGSCVTSFGNLEAQQIGSESTAIDTTANNMVKSISTYQIEYQRNPYGEIESSFSMGSKNSPRWSSIRRNITEQGLTITSSGGLVLQKDYAGRTISVTNNNNQRGLLNESFNYKNGLLEQSQINYLTQNVFDSKFSYNSFGEVLTSMVFLNGQTIAHDFHRDAFGRIETESVKTNNQNFNLKYRYKEAELTALSPYIDLIERDPFGNIIQVNYTNGAKLFREFSPASNRMLRIQFISPKNETLYSETYDYNNIQQMVSRTINSPFGKNSEIFNYDTGNYQLIPGVSTHDRDDKAQIPKINNQSFLYSDGNLEATNDSIALYGHTGEARAFCPRELLQTTLDSKCAYKLTDDEIVFGGYVVRRISVDGATLGFWLNGNFYPAISDHLNSIKALVKPDASKLLFVRNFGPWGEKSVRFAEDEKQVKSLEYFIVWSYAGLITNPIYEIKRKPEDPDLYWSQTRVYSPQVKEWLSPDSLVLWNPDALIANPYNWHPTRYAGNDPMKLTDLQGTKVELVQRELDAILLNKFFNHSFIRVTENDGKITTFSGYKLEGRQLLIESNWKKDYKQIGNFSRVQTQEILPPEGLSEAEWDHRVLEAGYETKKLSEAREYMMFGGNNQKYYGNCHTVSKEILDKAYYSKSKDISSNYKAISPGM